MSNTNKTQKCIALFLNQNNYNYYNSLSIESAKNGNIIEPPIVM
jgi:hypothetical protein